jgi:hypothetical protein
MTIPIAVRTTKTPANHQANIDLPLELGLPATHSKGMSVLVSPEREPTRSKLSDPGACGYRDLGAQPGRLLRSVRS